MNKVIGIDFGNTIVRNVKGSGLKKPFPDALRVVRRIAETYPVHIISKVNDIQKKHVLQWISDNDFFLKVQIPEDHLHFCAERWEKDRICISLGVTHHIDDRPEVVAHLNHQIQAYLFRPTPKDVVKYFPILCVNEVNIVQSWKEIERIFFR